MSDIPNPPHGISLMSVDEYLHRKDSPSTTQGEQAKAFWNERARLFDDSWPVIADLCRSRGDALWLAAECDRLTAELAALRSEKAATITKVEVIGHPGEAVSARCILSGCQDFSPTPNRANALVDDLHELANVIEAGGVSIDSAAKELRRIANEQR